MSINSMTVKDALQRANQAGRGSMRDLETLLKALAEGAVYDVYAGTPTSNLTPKAKGSWCLDTTNNVWYRAKGIANTDWVAIGEHGLTTAELTVLNVVEGTGAASRALVLDSSGDLTVPGAGDLDQAERLLAKITGEPNKLGVPAIWAKRRGVLARRAAAIKPAIVISLFINLSNLEAGTCLIRSNIAGCMLNGIPVTSTSALSFAILSYSGNLETSL